MNIKPFFTVLLASFLFCASSVNAQTSKVPFEKADVNGDYFVDISDIVAVINFMAYSGNVSFEKADVNGDDHVDISDVVAVINFMAYGGTDAAVEAGLCPDTNHPHIIDLGSAGKWSCCNVGASAPWEYGGYYAWGETENKYYCKEDSYIYFDNDAYQNGKYWFDCFKNLGSDIAGTDYDVAHVKWGGSWRMPSHDQQMLLLYNCSRERTTVNGIYGNRFTAPSGGSIFLPAAGYHWCLVSEDIGYGGYYWSSTQFPDYSDHAYNLEFPYIGMDSTRLGMDSTNNDYRYDGLSVRPVCALPLKSLLIFPKDIDFGLVSVGDSKSVTFSVKNTGTLSISFSVTVPDGIFDITDSGELFTLEPGESKTFDVMFSSYERMSNHRYTSKVVVKSSDATITHKVTLTASTDCPDGHHPHVVDMGEAGKWACCNVGASAPWEDGGKYAWGETEEKESYSWENYIHCDGSMETCHDLGDDIAGTQYDVAFVKWGGSWKWGGNWCLPSLNQLMRLIDNCSSEWAEIKGINGKMFTAPNGGTIFLPAPDSSDFGNYGINYHGIYWSSTQNMEEPYSASCLFFDSDIGIFNSDRNEYINYGRCRGYSVRPVINEAEFPDPAVESGLCPDSNHPHVIDMGEAGKWACCNVGASAPWEYGGYYAWGETKEKDYYDWNTYTHCDGSKDTCHDLGSDIASTDYDVAHVRWGEGWHLPSIEQIKLLNNCSSEWTEVNGINGMKYIAPTGGSIFLPALGYRSNDGTSNFGNNGYYWSSTQRPGYSLHAYYLYFRNGYTFWSYDYRRFGRSVRPVKE